METNEINELGVESIIVYTDGSAIPNPGAAAYGFFGIDNVGNNYNGYGPVGLTTTNNVAELTAVITAINYVKTLGIKKLSIMSDSKYVIDGINYVKKWRKNNWVTASGTTVANMSLWSILSDAIDSFRIDGILTFTWVRSHNGNYGNEQADQNATKGRLAMLAGNNNHFCEIVKPKNESEETIPTITPSKPKSKTAIEKLLPLLSGKKWFFNTNQTKQLEDGRWLYTISNYKDEKEIKNKNLAKSSVDTSYSIVLLKEPIKELNAIRDNFEAVFKDMIVPVVVNLSVLTKSKIWEEVVTADKPGIKVKGNLGVHTDSTVLAEVLIPPRLVYKLENLFIKGLQQINSYESSSPNHLIVDITDMLINTTAKGKQTISDTYNHTQQIVTLKDIPLMENSIVTDIKLVAGSDIISRTALGALLKQAKTPVTISLLISNIVIAEHLINSYCVSTIVECEDGTALYYSPDASYRILTQ